MAWYSNLLRRKTKPPAIPTEPAKAIVSTRPNVGLAGRRARITTDGSYYNSLGAIISPTDATDSWRTLSLDSLTLSRISPAKLIELMADASPEINRALWDFIRFCNPGWEARAINKAGKVDARGTVMLNDILARLNALYGAADVQINRLFISAFLRGAFYGEIVLDGRGSFVDLVTPDPADARFKKINDPLRGQIWQLGQYNAGQAWQPFTGIPTIAYVPVDPLPNSPYGRSVLGAAMFSALFLTSLLHDLRRVVSQQGYPRLDLTVNLEKLIEAMPAELSSDPEAFKNWVKETINEIDAVYSGLEPDDAYIHTDVVEVNRPVGTVDSSSLGAVDGLIRGLERMITRALKSNSLLMDNDKQSSEAYANRLWETHAAGIKSIQHLCEELLESLFSEALRARGIQDKVEWRFAELRASELIRDAQTETIKISNAKAKYDNGWYSQDQASEEVTGQPADQPMPRVSGNTSSPGLSPQAVIEGVERNRRRAVQIDPEGSENPLPELPGEVIINDRDIQNALDAWDAIFPDLAGLLEAQVVGRVDYDEVERALYKGLTLRARPVWEWNQSSKRYHNTETGQFIGQKKMTQLRDEFIDRQKERIADQDFNGKLAAGDISIQRWVLQQREIIKQTYIDQYILGHGGRNAMTAKNWGQLGNMLRDQYGYLQNFGAAIANGELSAAQIAAQSALYINSSTQAFEKGKASSYGEFTLPAYPGDGQSACKVNCRCAWSIRETEDAWECTWVIDTAAENCEDCQRNAATWSPLIISKTRARTVGELQTVLAASFAKVR